MNHAGAKLLVLATLASCGPQYLSRPQQVPPPGANARIVAYSHDLRDLDAVDFFQRPLMARLGALHIAGTVYFDDTRIVVDTPERDPDKLARLVRVLGSPGFYSVRDAEGHTAPSRSLHISGVLQTDPACECIARWYVQVKRILDRTQDLDSALTIYIDSKPVEIPRVRYVESRNVDTYLLEVILDPAHAPVLDKLVVAFAGGPLPGIHDAKLVVGGAP